jgi:serine/threonine protein kinase
MLPQPPRGTSPMTGHGITEDRSAGTRVTRARLAGLRRRRLHAGRNVTKAIVDLVELDGRDIVIKDVAARPWPVRVWLGPWQLDREVRAYGRLVGVPGVPRFLGRVDRQAIAVEFVPGGDLASARRGTLPAVFFDLLDGLVGRLHERGVAHGDLHRHDVISGPAGQPYVVDFSTAVVTGPACGPLTRLLFRHMRDADRRSVAKLRHRFLPDLPGTVPERRGLYRLGSALKRALGRTRRGRAGRRGPS